MNEELSIVSDEVMNEFRTSIVSGHKDLDITIPIIDGEGHSSTSVTSWSKTLSGYGEIMAPKEGSWHIVVKLNGNVFIDEKDVVCGQKIDFQHLKTGFKSNFEIFATWSEKRSTTLKLRLHIEW